MCHLETYHFDILIILSCRHWTNSKYRERHSLTSPYLLKYTQLLKIFSLGDHKSGTITFIREEKAVDTTHFVTTTPPNHFFKSCSFFLEIIYSPLRGRSPLFPFPIKSPSKCTPLQHVSHLPFTCVQLDPKVLSHLPAGGCECPSHM